MGETLLNSGYIYLWKIFFNLEDFTVALLQNKGKHTHTKNTHSPRPEREPSSPEFVSAYSISPCKLYKLGIILFSKLLVIF